MMKVFIILSVLATFCSSCPYKFKGHENFMTSVKQCATKLGISLDDFDKTIEKFHDPEVDDGCLSQCMLEKADLLGEDGGLDRDAMFDYLEEQAPKPLLTKLTEIVNKCADSTEIDTAKSTSARPKGQDRTVTAITLKPCKVYHNFQACFASNAKKLC